MLFLFTFATLLAVASTKPLSIIAREPHDPPQGYGVTHSGKSDLQISWGRWGECEEIFSGGLFPNAEWMAWDQPISNLTFNWVAIMSMATGVLDISTGDQCEHFVQQTKGEDNLKYGTCIKTPGNCLHYWQFDDSPPEPKVGYRSSGPTKAQGQLR